jgi:hypothetical protein
MPIPALDGFGLEIAEQAAIPANRTVARYRLRQDHRTWNVTNVYVGVQRDLSTFESSDLD